MGYFISSPGQILWSKFARSFTWYCLSKHRKRRLLSEVADWPWSEHLVEEPPEYFSTNRRHNETCHSVHTNKPSSDVARSIPWPVTGFRNNEIKYSSSQTPCSLLIFSAVMLLFRFVLIICLEGISAKVILMLYVCQKLTQFRIILVFGNHWLWFWMTMSGFLITVIYIFRFIILVIMGII